MKSSIAIAALVAMATTGCAATHGRSSCEELEGRCQTPDLPCGPDMRFGGYDACDVPNNACCIPAAPPPETPMGPFCLSHDECPEGQQCMDVWEARICSTPCLVYDDACPAELACQVPGDVSGYCVPPCAPDPVTGERPVCAPGFECNAMDHCVPTACAHAPPTDVAGCCYGPGDCATGEHCYGASCLDERPGRCLPRPPTRETCWVDADCAEIYDREPQRCVGAELPSLTCGGPAEPPGTLGTCA